MKQIFLLLGMFFYSSCTSLFYQPDSYLYSDPKVLKLNFEENFISSKDGTKLAYWYFKSDKKIAKQSLILFFHGNAQNISAHYYNLAWIVPEGHDFIIFDYRGYGLSEGKTTPLGVRNDGEAMLDFAYTQFKKGTYQNFIVYGQSLGGNVLLDSLKTFSHLDEISLGIFDSTFLSYQTLAREKLKSAIVTYPFNLLAYLLVSDESNSEKYVKEFTRPTLVIHGTSDKVIPFSFGEEIFEKVGAKDKRFWKVKDGEHIDVFTNHAKEYQKNFLDLLQSL